MTRLHRASGRVARWIPLFCRLIAAMLTTYPAARKFVAYTDRVEQFAVWGVPYPELAVPLSGVVEVVAIVSLVLGIGGRFGALALGGTMIVALLTAGPNVFIALVFVSCIVVVVSGTGPYSYWDPTVAELGRLLRLTGDTERNRRPKEG